MNYPFLLELDMDDLIRLFGAYTSAASLTYEQALLVVEIKEEIERRKGEK